MSLQTVRRSKPPLPAESAAERRQALGAFADEARIDELVDSLSKRYHTFSFAIRKE